jgi:predicted acyltransferase
LDDDRKKKVKLWLLGTTLVLLTLASRISISYYLGNDAPGDGVIYSQLGKNLLEQGVFSLDTQAPFSPTLVRLPGYPLFLAGDYAIFGVDNTPVRILQAVIDTGTCVLIALLTWLWTEDDDRKRRNALFAFGLVSLCPFIAIYAAMVLTETLTTFLMAAMALTATLALKADSQTRSFLHWIFTGLIAGASVMLRPDSGLFAAGIGLTLTISEIFLRNGDAAPSYQRRFIRAGVKGFVFTLAFIIVLAPWTIRNYRLFGVFQPLAPAHAEMPGEFVAHGYFRWLRMWVDDSRYTETMLWNLDEKPIRISKMPPQAFDSPEERERVAALLHQYNHPPGSEDQTDNADQDNSEDADAGDENSDDSAGSSDDSSDESADTPSDESDEEDEDDDDDENKVWNVEMTTDIDAQFGQIADERIARSPVSYYLFVPAKRAAALWFDSHSLYWPFGGQMSPISDLDYDEYQQYWLPAFTLLMWIYTLLAMAGAIRLWRDRANRANLRWLILVSLMTLPRIVFFSTLENPEPRYVVELFAFCAVLGAIYLGGLRRHENKPDIAEPLSTNRLLSLDVFRGATIAAMILVNTPGTWSAVYPQLLHAEWNGVTFTDLVFPFFLFIVGVSIAFSLGKGRDEGAVTVLQIKVIRRSAVLFAIGLLLEIFPFYNIWTGLWFDPATMRIMGVLQRITVCYLVAAVVFLHTPWRRQAVITAVLVLAYWALMTLVNVPGCEVTSISDKVCNLSAYIDRMVLTENHIWSESRVFDPEGLLSTLPAIATTLLGVLTGELLRSDRTETEKVRLLLLGGGVAAFAGLLWSFLFPFNKSLWTSSFALYTAGVACVLLGLFYWVIDTKGYRRWAAPFVVFGTNAIALFVGSSLIGRILEVIEIPVTDEKAISLQSEIFQKVFLPLASPVNASLLYSIFFVLVWLFVTWLLYRRGVIIKI